MRNLYKVLKKTSGLQPRFRVRPIIVFGTQNTKYETRRTIYLRFAYGYWEFKLWRL